MNRRIFKNNAFEENPEKLKPIIKTVFLNTDSSASLINAVIGIAMLFFCILAGTVGVVLCFTDSFSLDVTFGQVFFQSFVLLIIFTVIYLLPSKWFTSISFLAGAGLFGLYIYTNFEKIYQALYYTLNLCLYKITREGYIIGSIVDYGLARNPNPDAAEFVNTSVFLVILALVCIFSYIVYSKKSMWIALLISLVVIFPGFFYGFIPAYFPFSILVAFWVSVFAVNIFETGYIEDFINKCNIIPERKLEKYKYKLFKKQYYKNVRTLKSEIAGIVKSPNREDNSLRLTRLVRELQQISNNQDWFLRLYGLNKLYKPKKRAAPENVTNGAADEGKKAPKPKKEKFLSPLKLEKLRIKEEKRKRKEEQWAEYEANRNKLREMPLGKRFNTYLKQSFATKVERSSKSGYVGFFAFTIALVAIIAAQPFVSPQAKFKSSVPQSIMEVLTNTVEYLLVGSNSSIYGGYSGGMGGGFLLNPSGANFKYKPILKLRPTNNWTFADADTPVSPFPVETFQSGVVYLRGWYGNMYNGQRWFEADKTHIEDYKENRANFVVQRRFDESGYFEAFTNHMQNLFWASSERRNAELRKDSIEIEHLVSGGRASFIPYFNFVITPSERNFNMQKTADLSISLANPLNALFKYPEYAVRFMAVDNVLNRADVPVEDLMQYLDYYENKYLQDLEIANVEYNEAVSRRNEINEILYSFGFKNEDIIWHSENNWFEWHEYNNTPPGVNMDEVNRIVQNAYLSIYSNLPLRSPRSQVVKEMEPFYKAESAYYDFVMEHYLDVPPDFPQEIIDLAIDITKNANTDFEKALAIEQYLAENHEYTLNPMMPEDPTKDVVYNFLFEMQEGYCIYYATSMVMMLRALDIPSRYVEGYLIDMRRRERDIEGNQFITVYDSNGHAWPEVYFRGIGWIPFEPTTTIVETPAETQPYQYTPPARLPGYDSMGEMTTEYEDDFDDELLERPVDYTALYMRLGIVATVILIILALNLINYFINVQRAKYFKTAKAKDAVVKMLAYTLKFLKHCGFVMHNDEGLTAFAERVSSNLEIFTGVGFTHTADIMQRARYSKHEMTEKERLYVYNFVTAVKKNANKNLKPNLKLKFKYMYFIL